MNEHFERLSLKNDYVFKKIFGYQGNERYLQQFLSDLLDLDIKTITLKHDLSLEKNFQDEKYGILDVTATLNNHTEVNIEMQVKNQDNVIPRSTFYASKLISKQLKSGYEYNHLKPVIVIFIMDFDFFDSEEYITKSIMVKESDKSFELNNYIKYCYIELPKFKKNCKDFNGYTSQWLALISDYNNKEIECAMENNEIIKDAKKELEFLSGDEEERRKAELREKYVIEMNSAKAAGRKIGLEIGIQQGKEEGKEQGIKEGKEQGIKEGKEQGIKEGKEQGIKEGKEQGIKEGKEQGIKEGKEQGIKEGKEQGIEETKKQDILKLKAKNWSLEEIAEFVEMSIEDVKNIIDNI